MELKNKRLLILGGSSWKEAIKSFAEENEIVLVATGNDTNAGIFEIADEHYHVNSIDCDEMKKLIIEKKIDGVYMGGSETVISKACEYLQDLNMPCYCNKEQWEYLQNKSDFKELCIKYGLPVVPRYKVSCDSFEEDIKAVEYPVITKPTDSCGSNGFSICHNAEELKKGYAFAAENSISGEVMVEKFVDNRGVVVFYTFTEGKIIFSGLENKYPMKYLSHGSYVAGLHIFKSHVTAKFRELFEKKLQKLFFDIGIKEGSAWIEIFYNEKDFYFNEVGFRYSGSVSIYPVDYFYHINQVAADIHYALTGKSNIYGHKSLIKGSVSRKKHYCIYPVYVRAGKITKIEGIDKVSAINSVVTVIVTKGVGCEVKETGNFSQNFAMIHFVFDSLEEMKQTIRMIDSYIRIENEDGENMAITLDNDFLNKVIVD